MKIIVKPKPNPTFLDSRLVDFTHKGFHSRRQWKPVPKETKQKTFGFQDATTVNSSELYTAILSALLVNKFFTLSLNLKAEHNTARLLFSSNESAHSTPLKKKLLTGQFEKTFFGTQDSKTSNASQCMHESVYVVKFIISFSQLKLRSKLLWARKGVQHSKEWRLKKNNKKDKHG